MKDDANQERSRAEASKRAAELELRWQDARAQRQRAADLFHSVGWTPSSDDPDD
jgi:hypothetical protein